MGTVRPKRSDAIRNREKVLAAAAVVLAERGVEASVPEIAAAAGVGKATVYRSFPTKEHLLTALAVERFRDFAARCDAGAASPDPTAAFAGLLRDAARRQATDRLLVSAWACILELPEFVQAQRETQQAMTRLLTAAQAAGGLREDITAEDVRVLFGGFGRILSERDEADPEMWARYADLVVDALRA